MGGAPTGYEGLEYGGGELVAENNAEESATYEEQHVWKIVLTEDDKGADEQKGDPYEHLRGIPGHTVQVERGTPIEKERNELVHEVKKRDAGHQVALDEWFVGWTFCIRRAYFVFCIPSCGIGCEVLTA